MAKKKAVKKAKQANKSAQPKKALFYVGIRNSVDVRKTILESTKEFVQVLQMYENFSKLRPEIMSKTEQLQNSIKKIRTLISKLKSHLPETGLRAELIKKKKPVQKEEKKEKKAEAKQPSEIDALEAELNMIESKLNKIQ